MSVAAMIRLVSLASRMAASACGLARPKAASVLDRVDMAADSGVSSLPLRQAPAPMKGPVSVITLGKSPLIRVLARGAAVQGHAEER